MFEFVKKFFVKLYGDNTVSSKIEDVVEVETSNFFYFNDLELCVINKRDDKHVKIQLNDSHREVIYSYDVQFQSNAEAKNYVNNFTQLDATKNFKRMMLFKQD